MIDGGGYESTTSTKSSRPHPLSSFYAKIKSPESAPVRDILERFYDSESFLLRDGETRSQQAERV